MAVHHKKVRVVVEVEARGVSVQLFDAHGQRIEDERFALMDGAPDIDPMPTARDVFDLLYQCATTSVHDADW